MGSLVSVGFHGRTVKGWILGRALDPPAGRILPIRALRSPVRFFDARQLALLRWVSERYLAPLATVIERSHPPRVADVERGAKGVVEGGGPVRSRLDRPGRPPDVAVLERYGGAGGLLRTGVSVWLRPLPDDETPVAIAGVEACIAGGRRALVLVPEAEPLPDVAAAILGVFGPDAVSFAGGDARTRYATWLAIRSGRYRIVVGTRPAVFAPLADLGLIWISREVHPGHREDRVPYYHVRDVATARARLAEAACVLCSLSPSVETAAGVAEGILRTARVPRSLERDHAPMVETTPPEGEDRSVRLATLLKRVRSGALIVSRRGYGVARVCRACGEPAACAVCRGTIVVEGGRATCRVCRTPGRCAACGNGSFGVERGGVERIAQWARSIAGVPVLRDAAGAGPGERSAPGILVGTAASVKDVGRRQMDLVGILDPDRALSRPGIHAAEQSLATWMEAAVWAGSRGGSGRVLVQTRHPSHPAVQALVRWEPVPFLKREGERRAEAGFAPGWAVFRMIGGTGIEGALAAAGAAPALTTVAGGRTICLVTVRPEDLPALRVEVLRLATAGSILRVEAEPQL